MTTLPLTRNYQIFAYPPPQRDDSLAIMTKVLSELQGLRTYVGERFDSLDGRFEGMDTRITQLEEDVTYLRRCFDLPLPSKS